MTIVMDVERYLREALASFEGDPADTPYQEGYKAALQELYSEIKRLQKKT